MGTVITTLESSIGVITLNHATVNPLSTALIDDTCAALEQMQAQAVRVVILRAPPGAAVFSAGHDVRELPTNGRDPLTYNDPLRRLVRTIETYPHAVIAMVEGSVWGGACELVMSCDLIVAASDVTFAITPAKLGVPYDLAGTLNFLKGANVHLLKEMLFTAQPVAAARLAAAGVINHVVPREDLEVFTIGLARQIAQTSPLVQRTLKEELRVLAEAHPLNPEAYERIQALRRAVYDSNDYQEGIAAFFEKRSPTFQGT
ncbi:MAG TPA: methylmalonyl-CoA decarboxylase [Chloroflexota bacterium]|nr:methylmalonyl-CoA decarboxylase [Chloroflexota bacterium]